MHGNALLLETVAIVITLGIGAQVVADRFKIPAILPLLLLGMACGPQALGLFDPAALGGGLEVLIKLGVAIILFEGGLSLDPRQLRQVGGAVRNLLTVGVVVTGFGGAWLAHAVTGLAWPAAALFGAIVTVTGPTVIVPLLRHMIAPRRVRTVLVSEGLIVDPIGAVLAYLVLQWIERAGTPFQPLTVELLVLVAVGAGVGFIAGSLARVIASSRLVGRELRNLVILALLVATFVLAERQVAESGILASVVMGLTLSAAQVPDLEPLRSFKEQLTVLLISVLFVLLSGQLDLGAVWDLGWSGLVVVAGLILVVRPAAVLASVWPGQLDWRGRTLLALTAPRGIVAAAVASLSAIALRGMPGMEGAASTFEGLVYLVILVTGMWATAMAVVLPRVLGYVGDPSRRLTVLVGANALSFAVGRTLADAGRKVVVIDSVPAKLDRARDLGLLAACGDARDAATYERAGVERDAHVLALTSNDELNLLVAELVREEFGIEHPVVALQRPSEEFGSKRRAWIDLFGGRGFEVGRWIRWFEADQATTLSLGMDDDLARRTVGELLVEEREEVVFLCGWEGGEPRFRIELDADVEGLGGFAEVTLLAVRSRASEIADRFNAEPVDEPTPVWEGPLPLDGEGETHAVAAVEPVREGRE